MPSTTFVDLSTIFPQAAPRIHNLGLWHGPVVKRADLVRHQEAHGCVLLREGGRHSVYYNRSAQRTSTVPRHREVKNPTAIHICKQLNVPDPLR